MANGVGAAFKSMKTNELSGREREKKSISVYRAGLNVLRSSVCAKSKDENKGPLSDARFK